MKYATNHKVQAAMMASAVVVSISVSGYAYAQGTDPVSLVKRWVSGDKVKIEYAGRTFEHGTKRSYSDAAISAYAELHTVEDLHFRASNQFTVPQGGIEHVSNANARNYHQPWVGVVERTDEVNVYLRRVYIIGDKVSPSRPDDQLVTIPRARLSFYVQGEPTQPSMERAGRIAVVYQDNYLEHRVGSGVAPTPVEQFFGFEVTHGLADIKAADQGARAADATATSDLPLYEPSWGGTSDICLNNGADRCDQAKLAGDVGQGLYGAGSTHNPDVVAYGEMVADSSQQQPGLIIRNTEGKITRISGNIIKLRSSSDSVWTLTVKPGLLETFKKTWGKPLGVGDRIGVSLIGSVNDLDNRTVDNAHIYNLKRY